MDVHERRPVQRRAHTACDAFWEVGEGTCFPALYKSHILRISDPSLLTPCEPRTNVVNVSLLELDTTLVVVAALVSALCRLVDLEVRLELPVRLQITRLVGRVLVDDVCALVLELSEREEDDVAGYDPDLGSAPHQEEAGCHAPSFASALGSAPDGSRRPGTWPLLVRYPAS